MSNNLPVPQQQQAVSTIGGFLQRNQEQFKRALPAFIPVDRFLRVALTTIRKVPKLAECSPESLAGALVESAQLGLMPDGILGHAYLVPYKVRRRLPDGRDVWEMAAQLQVGYKGLIALARRSGELASIQAQAVHQDDEFDFELGIAERLVHRPKLDGERGPAYCYYAVATFKDGSHALEIMTRSDVDKIRARSKAGDSGPWQTDFDEMAKKTVIRRLAKRLPLQTDDFQRAAMMDEMQDLGLALDGSDAVFTPPTDADAGEDELWAELLSLVGDDDGGEAGARAFVAQAARSLGRSEAEILKAALGDAENFRRGLRRHVDAKAAPAPAPAKGAKGKGSRQAGHASATPPPANVAPTPSSEEPEPLASPEQIAEIEQLVRYLELEQDYAMSPKELVNRICRLDDDDPGRFTSRTAHEVIKGLKNRPADLEMVKKAVAQWRGEQEAAA